MNEYFATCNEILGSTPTNLNPLWILIVLTVGLIIGSYLNVIIYRGSAQYLPEETKYKGKLDSCTPKNSFCPQCLHALSWVENIPLISWIIQGAKCKHCRVPIPVQYPLVEAINALGWTALWIKCPTIGEFLVYAAFLSILICVTAIDLKTLRIPNKITLSGIAILLALIALTSPSKIPSSILSALGAGLLGYFLVEIGKFLFGKKTIKLKNLTEFKLDQKNKAIIIQDEGKSLEDSEPLSLNELFARETDAITIEGEIDNVINKRNSESYSLEIKKDEVKLIIKDKSSAKHEEKVENEAVITGKIKTITMPQEALGMGDVKLLILIGVALGYPDFVHAMTLGAVCALVYAGVLRITALARKNNAPSLIAFGPWLSAASVAIIMFRLLKCP
jgi:prepilin signal peptidase PulO-like enzyme (type II secretory pathway)